MLSILFSQRVYIAMRCRCKKQDGLQCNREANEQSMFCWQHQIYCPQGLIKQSTLTVPHSDPLMDSYKSASQKSNSSVKSHLSTSKLKSNQSTPAVLHESAQKAQRGQSNQRGQRSQRGQHSQSIQQKQMEETASQSASAMKEGGYGCVYSPPLSCANDSLTPDGAKLNTDYADGVMKVMYTPSATSEIRISEAIRKIDRYNDYFLPLSGESCPLDSEKSYSQLLKCMGYRYSDHDKKDFRGYFMKNGGQTYDTYVFHQDPPIGVIWEHLKHLLTALEILKSAQIVHMDIKLNNIMIKNSESLRTQPVLIDFGIGFFAGENEVSSLRHLEFDGAYPLFYSALGAKDINQLYDEYEFFVQLYQPQYQKGGDSDLIKKLWDQSRDRFKYINEVIWPHRFKIDLNMLMLTFNEVLNSNRAVYETQNPVITEALTALIEKCLNPDPSKLFNLEEALTFVKSIQS